MEKKRKSLATSMRSTCEKAQRSLWERWMETGQSSDRSGATSRPESPLPQSNKNPRRGLSEPWLTHLRPPPLA